MRTKYINIILLFTLSLTASNCQAKAETIFEPYSDGIWVMNKIDGKTPRTARIYNIQSLSIQFKVNGNIFGFGGCNRIFGKYTVNSSTKSIQVKNLNFNERGCGKKINRQETAFIGMVNDLVKYDIKGDKLILTTKKAEKISFKFVRNRKYNDKLTGKKWILSALSIVKGTLQSTRVKMTLRFKDGRFTASSACLSLKGKYVKSGNKLSFQDVKIRKKSCQGSLEEENLVRDILKGAETFKLIKGKILYIQNKENLELRLIVS